MTIARYVGLSAEESFNQKDNPPEADFHVDITSATLDAPSDTQMFYGGGLQRSAKVHRPGFYSPDGNIVYAFDVRTITYLLAWTLGGYMFTEDAEGLNTHECYGSKDNILPSFVTRVGKDFFEHVFTGCVIDSLEIQVEDGFAVATATINAAQDAKDRLKEISELSLPEEYPLAFHEVTATKKDKDGNGEDISADVRSITININNNMDADQGRGLGSRHPYRIIAGERETTISKPLFYRGSGPLEELWGQETGVSQGGPETFELELDFDGGEFGAIKLLFPRCIYTQVQQQPSNRDITTQGTDVRALLGDEVELANGNGEKVETEVYAKVDNGEGRVMKDTLTYEVTFEEENEEDNVDIAIYSDEEKENEVETVTTGSGGTAIATLTRGDYWFTASKDGFEDYEGSFTVDADKTVTFTLMEV